MKKGLIMGLFIILCSFVFANSLKDGIYILNQRTEAGKVTSQYDLYTSAYLNGISFEEKLDLVKTFEKNSKQVYIVKGEKGVLYEHFKNGTDLVYSLPGALSSYYELKAGENQEQIVKIVQLLADKTEILADNTDEVSFLALVKDQNGKIIVDKVADIYVNGTKITGDKFKTSKEGTYEVLAKVEDISSSKLSVKAIKVQEVSSAIVSLSKASIKSDNADTSTITYILMDEAGNVVNGRTADIYVNGSKITGNTFKTATAGTYEVYAQANEVKSAVQSLVAEKQTVELKVTSIELSANNTLIKADGTDKVSFAYVVKDQNNKIMIGQIADIYVNGSKITGTTFTTSTAGTYKVNAKIGTVTSNEISVIAQKVENPSVVSSIELTSSKGTIIANGTDVVTFTYKVLDQYGKEMTLTTEIKDVLYVNGSKITGNTFKTSTEGTYKVSAKIGTVTSNEILIIATPAGKAMFTINNVSVNEGETFEVVISAAEFTTLVGGVDIRLEYDSTMVELIDEANPTNAVTLTGNLAGGFLIVKKASTNIVALAVAKPGSTSINGDNIFKVKFKAKKAGTTELSFNQVEVSNPDGDLLDGFDYSSVSTVKVIGEVVTPVATSVEIKADKTSIAANGTDTTTFTAVVKDQNGNAMSLVADIYVNGSKITGNTFKTSTAGTYEVYAKYSTIKSNVLSIKALSSETPAILISSNKTMISAGEEFELTLSTANLPSLLGMDAKLNLGSNIEFVEGSASFYEGAASTLQIVKMIDADTLTISLASTSSVFDASGDIVKVKLKAKSTVKGTVAAKVTIEDIEAMQNDMSYVEGIDTSSTVNIEIEGGIIVEGGIFSLNTISSINENKTFKVIVSASDFAETASGFEVSLKYDSSKLSAESYTLLGNAVGTLAFSQITTGQITIPVSSQNDKSIDLTGDLLEIVFKAKSVTADTVANINFSSAKALKANDINQEIADVDFSDSVSLTIKDALVVSDATIDLSSTSTTVDTGKTFTVSANATGTLGELSAYEVIVSYPASVSFSKVTAATDVLLISKEESGQVRISATAKGTDSIDLNGKLFDIEFKAVSEATADISVKEAKALDMDINEISGIASGDEVSVTIKKGEVIIVEPGEGISYGVYATNPNSGKGKSATITIDGAFGDWSEDMLIVQGAANDDPRIFKGSHEGPVYDLYSLYAAWDSTNLYLMWQYTNVTDVADPAQGFPISDNGKPWNGDIPIAIAFDVDPSVSANGLVDGTINSVWAVGTFNTFANGADHLAMFSAKPGVGKPAIFKANSTNGQFDYEDENIFNFKENGISFLYGDVQFVDKVYGINKNGWAGYTPEDLKDESLYGDFNTLGHDKAQDTCYEMQIPLSVLGIDKSYLEANGIGVMLISTFGQSAIDSLPHDECTLDNALEPYGPDESSSHEKDDEDNFTVPMARIGK